MLDDGRITDSQGRTVDFKNTILILTSNLGSNFLLDGIDASGNITEEAQTQVNELLKRSFRPEFLNRLDEIVMYKPLTREDITKIVDLMIADVNRRLSDRQLSCTVTPEAKEFIVENGYDPMYGARPLRRFIQRYVETLIAKTILSGDLQMDSRLVVDCQDGVLSVSVTEPVPVSGE